ncbi:hypothetical protein VUR80DRAFT_3512 [Thermomyces stellatus]
MPGLETASIATGFTLSRINKSKLAPSKPSLSVRLFDHYASKVYNAGSTIHGEVLVNSPHDLRFGSVEIAFVGVSRTILIATQVPQRSSHSFLKLNMPIPESEYPHPRVFEQGRSYAIPFNFVVPAQLTLSACKHEAENPQVKDYHMRLPPTMGPGDTAWGKDDLSPDTAHIEYFVRARVLGEREEGRRRPEKLIEAQRTVRVLPLAPEDAPLDIDDADERYSLSKTKTIRKGVLGSKIGRVTVTASQPPAIHLSSDGRAATPSGVTIRLAFEPKEPGAEPPKVRSVSAKLAASTHYGVTPAKTLPDMGTRAHIPTDPPRLSYKAGVSLLSTDIDGVNWEPRTAAMRRDSGYSTEHGVEEKKEPTHEAAIYVPLELPAGHKTFVPTFHSCLVSRVYAVQLTLSIGPANTAVQLVVPVQVAVEATEEGMALSNEADEAAEADEFLRPRVLRVPSELPGYA